MLPLAMTFHDVNDAYWELMRSAPRFTQPEATRNGTAQVFQMPVLIEHAITYRKVLFDPVRDANPFFHYMECIWMLSGEQEIAFLEQFVPRMKTYSDDGITLNGAYGYRWRYHFEEDQIERVISMLQRDRYTRRAVLGMWDPSCDLDADSKDLPCNTHIYFRAWSNYLDMTVCNRSNDLVWGMLGANIVHMSALHEYITYAVGLQVGSLFQFTNNLHIYEDWVTKFTPFPSRWYYDNPSMNRWVFSPDTLDQVEAERFVNQQTDTDEPYRCRIIRDNAEPMYLSHKAHKDGDDHLALHYADKIRDDDWRAACRAWIERRMNVAT